MGEAAVTLARDMGYQSAGTIECLVTDDGDFYFLEMNTRLQVEHPVTEAVTGVDLVREMVRVAAGLPLSIPEEGIPPRGHAIEASLYAEDPAGTSCPRRVEITRLDFPDLPNLRVDTGARAGTNVTVYYDPLIAKLVAWGEDRDAASPTCGPPWPASIVEGVKTNLPFLQRIFTSADFAAGRISHPLCRRATEEIMAGQATEFLTQFILTAWLPQSLYPAYFRGTVPVKNKGDRSADAFRLRLHDPTPAAVRTALLDVSAAGTM